MADIKPALEDCDPSKVTAKGAGIQSKVAVNEPVEFIIDASQTGKAPLLVTVNEIDKTPLEVTVRDNKDGTYTCSYVPKNPVKHVVVVTYAGVMIPKFPVRVSVEGVPDPSKVKVSGPAVERPVKTFEPTNFLVDCSKAGPGDVGVSLNDEKGQSVAIETASSTNGIFDVSFTPKSVGTYTAQIYYADQAIPSGPFKIKVEPSKGGAGDPSAGAPSVGAPDASKVHVYGDGVKPTGVNASLPVSFLVDTSEAGVADLDVLVQDPLGRSIRPVVQDQGNGVCAVPYTPESIGNYSIPIKFGGKPVPASPFNVKAAPVGDASKVKFIDTVRTTIPVGEECVINIDPSEAGPGNVTCRIASNSDSDVEIAVVDNGDGTVSIMYTPLKPGAYTLEIKFGGSMIPDGNFTQQALGPDEYREAFVEDEPLTAQNIGRLRAGAPQGMGGDYLDTMDASDKFQPVGFVLPVGPIFNFVSAEITTPSGKKQHPKVVDNKNGTVGVQYSPSELGLHKLAVKYNDVPIEGSPFEFFVDESDADHVTAHGPGLSHGTAGSQCDFTIVTKNAVGGGLGLAVEGPSKAALDCKDNGDGSCSVSYFPVAPGEYKIAVKYDEKDIKGSPFTAKISPAVADQQKTHLAVGASSDIPLSVTETDLIGLQSTIVYPSGKQEPCLLKRLDNGQLGISFTPRESGEHLVNVLKYGKHIANSPFKIHVGASEIGNAARVKAYGRGLSEGMVNEISDFIVDTKNAGYGGLSLSIEGPSKADIECTEEPDGTCRVSYKPTEPGNYVVNVKFADEHVPGSPFLVKVDGEPSGRLTERILRQTEAADDTRVGSECELSLKIPETTVSEMEALVMSPSGHVERCDISDIGDKQYSIKFVPREIGVHTVSVKHKGMHIPGSPFQFTVGPITEGGAHKVRALGPGLQRAVVNVPSYFNIITREAGAGSLSVAMEGPSKAEIDFIDHKDGSCEIAYTCAVPGDYVIYIKYNDQNIPDAPFKVHVSPRGADGKNLSLQDLKDHGCQINQPAAFTIDLRSAQGKTDAVVVSPSGAEDEAVIQQLDNDHVAIRFIPRENGIHQIYVRHNGVPIPGSPFTVVVGEQNGDPALVRAFGEGLSKGQTGVVSKFIVDTLKAGAGALAVNIDGPSKVQLNCSEVSDGYEFTYVPVAPGDYLVSIKYAGNNHIPGSPFKARVTGSGRAASWNEQSQVVVDTVTKATATQQYEAQQPISNVDVSKVITKGTGLLHAELNKDASFTIDASRAAYNMLLVGVMGPHVPCEEVTVKHLGNVQFSVVYRPAERGDYILVVKWGDKHIPGSPFHLLVE